MKNKKIILSVGSIIALTPVIAAVSCTTSWTKWTVDKVSDTSVVYHPTPAPDNLWKMPSDKAGLDDLMTRAYDETTFTINMDEISNQFEFIYVVGEAIGLNSSTSVDLFYNDYEGMKNYVRGFKEPFDLKLSFNGNTESFNWDVHEPVSRVIAGINTFPQTPAFPVAPEDVDASGKPIDFNGVSEAGISFINIDIVANLLSLDSDFALALSKLVNLPDTSFIAFQDIVTAIDEFTNQIFGSHIFDEWVAAKNVDLSISPSTGIRGIFRFTETDIKGSQIELLKGMFLKSALCPGGLSNLGQSQDFSGGSDILVSPNIPETYSLSLNDISSPQKLIEFFGSKMNSFMTEKPWDISGGNLDSEHIRKVREYAYKIETNKTFILSYTTPEGKILKTTVDFTPVTPWVRKINDILGSSDFRVPDTGAAIGNAMMSYGLPEIAAMSGNMIGSGQALKMAGFMQITDSWDPNNISDSIASHPYIQMLNSYHQIIWDFVNSEAYNKWIDGKTFSILKPSGRNGWSPVLVHPGEGYDINPTNLETNDALAPLNSFQPAKWFPVVGMTDVAPKPYKRSSISPYPIDSNGAYQMSNFEALFAMNILDLVD